MKTPLLIFGIVICFAVSPANAQVAINATNTPANASAMLEVSSATKGFLPPRMLKTDRDLISQPATGLMIYQTDDVTGLYCNTGTPATPLWQLIGPAISLAYANFTGNTLQSVNAAGSYQNIIFPVTSAINNITFNSATNTATIVKAGVYRVAYHADVSVASNQLSAFIAVNGVNVSNGSVFHTAISTVTAVISDEYLLTLAAGDNITIRVINVTGSGTQNIFGRSLVIMQLK